MSRIKIKVGRLLLGGKKIIVQSMTNTRTSDIKSTVSQIKKLSKAGCELIRVSVPDEKSAEALKQIKARISIPLAADIHFDHKLAVASIKNGADKIRINPGNIGGREKVKEVVRCADDFGVPIRIGVNAGSLQKNLQRDLAAGKITVENAALLSVKENVALLENLNFKKIIISAKLSSAFSTIKVYEKLSRLYPYPLHLGVTEAGTFFSGALKTACALGYLLTNNIGDTIRVSLSGDPVKEIDTAYKILQYLNIRKTMPEVIACPTCARTQIDVEKLALKIEKEVEGIQKYLKIAVMGCVVNGPGESKEADIGVCGGKDNSLIYKKGKLFKKINNDKLITELKNIVADIKNDQGLK